MTVEKALEQLRQGHVQAALAALSAPELEGDLRRPAALGMVAMAMGDVAGAHRLFREAVAAGDCASSTLLNLAVAEALCGDVGKAHEQMRAIAAHQPQWDEPWVRLGESLRRQGDQEGAVAAYARTLELNPTRREALVGLAALRMRMGDPAAAQMLLLQACSSAGDSAEVWDALGVALMLTGDHRPAESAFARACALAPADVGIAVRRVEAAVAAGGGEAEYARLTQVSDADPLDIPALTARGVLAGMLGLREDAVGLLSAAEALAPDSAPVLQALGNAMVTAGQIGPAVPILERAAAMMPEDSFLQNNLAAGLIKVHRYAQAREILQGVLARDGENPGVLCNLTNALVSLGLQDEGLTAARRAVALAPQSPVAWRAMANALSYHADVTGAALLETQKRVSACLPRREVAPFANVRDGARPLRVGLLSPTLKTHPVGWLTVAAFEGLDRAQFQLVCFGQAASADSLQRRFAAICHAWHEVDGLPHAAIADLIRAEQIDVLIDLGGYGDRGMLPVCAYRPAPVQIKWVGSQAHSTGLAEMDWFITDRWETPPELAHHYSEKLMMMPDGYVCYSPPSYAPAVTRLPALERGYVTFGCFNNLAKMTPRVIEAWAGILRRVSGSRLLLKGHQFGDERTQERLHAAFAAQGIGADRVEMRGGSPHRDLLAQYGGVDIVLDPFPYTGGLTTCEALWMGVPTVCLAGETFAARHSTSHMSNVGLQDWVARDVVEYQALAERKAGDLAGLATLRDGLRQRVAASPLCDGVRFGGHLGRALRSAWQEWCGAA